MSQGKAQGLAHQERCQVAPTDILTLEPDGSVKTPGIGHMLYIVKDNEKLPVRYHSVKLPEGCAEWSPCEVEALALASGIDAEYDLIRESVHPLLVYTDSKVVTDAVNLIKKAKYSAHEQSVTCLQARLPVPE